MQNARFVHYRRFIKKKSSILFKTKSKCTGIVFEKVTLEVSFISLRVKIGLNMIFIIS